MLKKIFILLFLSKSIIGQIVQYDFSNTLNPSIGTATLTPGGSVPHSYTTDRFGNANSALSLNPGTSDLCYMDMGTSDNLPVRTVCFWFKAYSSTGNIQMIYESDGSHINFGQTQFGILNGTMDYLLGGNHASEPIVLNKWYFAAITTTGFETKFYLNCKLVATGTTVGNFHSAAAGYQNGRIGYITAGPTGSVFNYRGAVDEFRIYNSVLSPSQLITIMGTASLTSSFNMANSFCVGAAITADGTASVGTPINETNHYWEIIECDVNGNVSVGAPVWFNWYAGEASNFTFPSAANGGPNFITCGKYYRVKLAVQNCLVTWAESAKIIRINCLPTFSAGSNKTLCPGGTVSLGGKTLNQNLAFSWQPTTWIANPNISMANISIPSGYTTPCPGSTTYTLTVTDITTGCSNTSSATVNYATGPTIATISESKTAGCVNGNLDCSKMVTLTAGNCQSGVSYSWSNGINPPVNSPIYTTNVPVPTTYSLTTSNVCFNNVQPYNVSACYKPTGAFPLLSVSTNVLVNWSGNYGPGGFKVFDNTIPQWTGPAYNATRLKMRIFSRWGTQLYEQDVCPSCGGTWSGILFYNCIYQGQPLPIDSYAFEIIMDNCSQQGYVVAGTFNVIGHAKVQNEDGTHEDIVKVENVVFKNNAGINSDDQITDENSSSLGLSIFPNPGNGIFTINVLNTSTNCSLEISDLLGNKVGNEVNFANEAEIDLSEYASGIYIAKVKAGNKLITKKIIKN